MTQPIIRTATEADLDGIVAIYNEVIANSFAIYSNLKVDRVNRWEWISGRAKQGYPVLISVDDSGVTGLSSFGDFRSFPGYRHTVEHSVHVRADQRGKGLGSALVSALFAPARALGKHVMIGAIDSDNPGSLRFHQRLGFFESGRLPEVGYKNDTWRTLVFMQKMLEA
jgi:L-amino acid N-acyltransferase YncA